MPKGMHSPLPASLRSECEKASVILDSFITPSVTGNPGAALHRQLANAKGLVILTGFRASFLGSLRVGSGLVVARLDDGSWSAPSAVTMFGGGFGGQVGFELTDFVFVLTSSAAVRDFAQAANFALSAHISIAFGPVGRSAEITAVASPKGVSRMFAYSKTKGLYGGVAVEGSFYIQVKPSNKSLYQRQVTAQQLLSGEIPAPPEAESLMRILSSEAFSPRPSDPEAAVEGTRGLSDAQQAPQLPTSVNGPEAAAGSEREHEQTPAQVPELHANALSPELPTEDRQISELSTDTQQHELEAGPETERTPDVAPVSVESQDVSPESTAGEKVVGSTEVASQQPIQVSS
ncbi:hypothetical protein AOR_1_182074 [Paecilomyces variotii No. 5]|uniref:Ysc84 actin-binding domain-containing protein n=1 Tax=Byssochlamys spectabilis (strain No. 5 / NBRC 109023) TaxID=1356009 RepID=V5GB39_BYSSN|nr:hypothetical protein AOR_1_182074 [Paecilomyces variotii No. 5]